MRDVTCSQQQCTDATVVFLVRNVEERQSDVTMQ